jgi:hypothetical protein
MGRISRLSPRPRSKRSAFQGRRLPKRAAKRSPRGRSRSIGPGCQAEIFRRRWYVPALWTVHLPGSRAADCDGASIGGTGRSRRTYSVGPGNGARSAGPTGMSHPLRECRAPPGHADETPAGSRTDQRRGRLPSRPRRTPCVRLRGQPFGWGVEGSRSGQRRTH